MRTQPTNQPTTHPCRYNDDFMDITNNGTEVGRIRLAQYSALSLPKVFLAAGYDLNDDSSPYGPVHFRNKQDVGRRLARSALENVYGTLWGLWGLRMVVVCVGRLVVCGCWWFAFCTRVCWAFGCLFLCLCLSRGLAMPLGRFDTRGTTITATIVSWAD
jgi:hypothetical protein